MGGVGEGPMKVRFILVFALLVIGLGTASLPAEELCWWESQLDRHWGTAFRSAVKSQILNPDAGLNLREVTGIDGQAADVIMYRYRNEFKKPAPPPRVFLDIGGVTSGGGQSE